ncbi:unnamed protein product, partial [Closterium sp. Naga37s-1]
IGSKSGNRTILNSGGSMVAPKRCALVVAAVLQLLLLLAGNVAPCAGQSASQECYWPLISTQSEILASVAANLDYFPYEMSFITTCVNVGLTCSDDGYVTGINWQYKAIQGELPSEIFQLVHLEYLSLRDNYLRGSIPSEIGNLVNLTSLDLTNNSFSGPFPTFLSKLKKLSYLYLGLNKFSGSLPEAIGSMVSLGDLALFDNELSGTLPSSIGRLTNLYNLGLARNRLSGSLPNSFSNMASLSSVQLDNNMFTGSLAPLAALSSLSAIFLCCNRFNGTIPPTFSTNVFTDFDVSVNDLTGPLPSGLRFSEPPGGPNFNSSFNRLSGEIPFDFNVNFFFTLNYSHNRFSGVLDPSLSTLTYLHDLDMSGNLLTGSIPAFISLLTNLTMLASPHATFSLPSPSPCPPPSPCPQTSPCLHRSITLPSTSLLTSTPPCPHSTSHPLIPPLFPAPVAALPACSDLSSNQLNGAVPNVSSNQLSGDITPSLSPLRFLEIISSPLNSHRFISPEFLSFTPHALPFSLHPPMPCHSPLSLHPSMPRSDISANTLNGSVPPFFGLMPNMTHLDMAINLLSGSVPPAIFNLRRLSHLNMSRNRLSGPLPNAAASPALIIDLSFNTLSGTLESQHVNLKRLALLALHHNQLSGPIPEYLCQSALQIMLLSSNAFSGALPQCLPFEATNPQWVWGAQGGQLGAAAAGGASGGNSSSSVAWLAVEGNCVGSEVVGQQRGATECVAVCGIEPGQGPCGGAGAGQCVVQSGWPPSLSCSCASGYVAVTAAGTANTTTCELPPPSASSSGLSAGAVAGIVVGAVLLLAAVAGLLIFFLRPSQRRSLDLDQCVAYRIEDIRRATNNFAPESKLGEGGFGSVFKGTAPDGTLWAIKRAKFLTNDFEKEVRAVATLRHQHLVRLLGYCMDYNAATGHQEQILVYEFVPHGDLSHYLHTGDAPPGSTRVSLSFEELLRIAQGAAEGLAYLHHSLSPPIVHRDVKPANILIGEGRTAKLGDFGLVKTDNLENATNLAGTPGYMDPDYGDSKIVTTASDVFSFGVVLLEMVSGKRAVLDESDIAFSNRHISIWANELVMAGKITQVVMEDLKAPPDAIIMFVDLAMDCLKRPGALRPEMRDVARRLTNILAVAQGNVPVGWVKQKSVTDSTRNDSSVKAVDEAEPLKKEIA